MNSFVLNHNSSSTATTISKIVNIPSISTFFPSPESVPKLPNAENIQSLPVNLPPVQPFNTPIVQPSTTNAVQEMDSKPKRKRSTKNSTLNEDSSSKDTGDEMPKSKKRARAPKKEDTDGRRRRNPPKIIWDADKDKILLDCVNNPQYRRTTKKGTNLVNWSAIKKEFFPEATVQCIHQRYHRVIDPELKKESWTAEEDKKILELVELHGNHSWAEISKFLPGRPDTKIKSRFIQLTKNNPSTSNSPSGTTKKSKASTPRRSKKTKYDSEELAQDSEGSEDSQAESDTNSVISDEENESEEEAENDAEQEVGDANAELETDSKKIKRERSQTSSPQVDSTEETSNFVPRIVTRRTRSSQSNLLQNEVEGREGFLKLIEIASSIEDSSVISPDSTTSFDHNFEAETATIASYAPGSTHTKIFSIKLSQKQSEAQSMELLTKRATEYCNHFQNVIEAISLSFNTISKDSSPSAPTVFCVVMFRKLLQPGTDVLETDSISSQNPTSKIEE